MDGYIAHDGQFVSPVFREIVLDQSLHIGSCWKALGEIVPFIPRVALPEVIDMILGGRGGGLKDIVLVYTIVICLLVGISFVAPMVVVTENCIFWSITVI